MSYKFGTRRVFPGKFKFSIVYLARKDEVVVLAVAPFRRKPDYDFPSAITRRDVGLALVMMACHAAFAAPSFYGHWMLASRPARETPFGFLLRRLSDRAEVAHMQSQGNMSLNENLDSGTQQFAFGVKPGSASTSRWWAPTRWHIISLD